MKVVMGEDGKRRYIRYADPTVKNGQQRIEFALTEELQITLDGGETWELVPEAQKPDYKTVHLNEHTTIDPSTKLFIPEGTEGAVGFYSWFRALNAGQLGITSPDDNIFDAEATAIEDFLTVNDLW